MRLNNNNISHNVNCSGVEDCDAAFNDADSAHSHSQMETPVMTKKRKLDPAYSNISVTTTGSSEAVEPMDSSYCIEHDYSSGTDLTSSQGTCTQQQTSVHEEDKYIVFRSCLWQLFSNCPVCAAPCAVIEQYKGTLLVVNQKCSNSRCHFTHRWDSQPFVGSIPAGNVLLSAAILFNGASHRKTLKLLRSLGLVVISESTYLLHARSYLQPTIYKVWSEEQKALIEELAVKPGGMVLGGDGRADSPGHSARFGSYTTMELRLNKVIDIQLVQSNEVGGSYHMELEGLKRSVGMLWKHDLEPSVIISDRHASIQKWIRDKLPDTQHFYDVWHVAKGVTKKMEQLANQKGCELVREWIRSVSNHMYYCAASSAGESGDMVVAKWKSVAWHMQNIHAGHDDPLFDQCTHPPLDSNNQRKWLEPNTKACEKLIDILLNKRLWSDVKKLSSLQQTSSVEDFHSLVIQAYEAAL